MLRTAKPVEAGPLQRELIARRALREVGVIIEGAMLLPTWFVLFK